MEDKVKIEITNDGKEKYQSCEAKIDHLIISTNGYYTFRIEGYGETEIESLSELRKNLKNMMYLLHIIDKTITEKIKKEESNEKEI